MPVTPISDCEELFTTKLTMEEENQMVMPNTDKEIRKAMFSIDDNKAPRLDGYSDRFFKKSWHIVGDDVCKAVKKFFTSGKLLGELNATIVSLTPKINTPLLGYNRVEGPKRVAFKIDIQKAYDTGGRGLKPGDPMSPYLFTLVMEVFTLIMKRNVRNNAEFNYHFRCKNLKITHICFANDLMVFCHGDPCSMKVVKDSIDEFGKCSGLLPNFSKSIVFFGSIKEDEQQTLLSILPFGKASVLESIHTYWCCVFLLPKSVVKDINRIMKNSLWSHTDESKGKAKIAWKSVCKPKSQGGLRLKDLLWWNKALLVKHL
ncbi:RNA-directed DNA polymerase, eukaryota, reverse transcriptase zinc-binding domain protein [Tanacetum coccineum]